MNLELIWSSALPMLERRELDRENAGEAIIELFLKKNIIGKALLLRAVIDTEKMCQAMYHLICSKGSWEELKSLKLKCFQVPLMRTGIFH